MVDILKSSLVLHFAQMRLCEHGCHKKTGGNMLVLFKKCSRDERKIEQRSIGCQQQKGQVVEAFYENLGFFSKLLKKHYWLLIVTWYGNEYMRPVRSMKCRILP